MIQVFKDDRTYILGDPELEFIGSKQKLAQWRYRKFGPAWISIGRKILYLGRDLNSWLEENRTVPVPNRRLDHNPCIPISSTDKNLQ